MNAVKSGELNGGADVDFLVFEGRKGQRLFLDLEAERIDSRLDATIRMLTPEGTELAESRDVFGVDPFLDVTLPADGAIRDQGPRRHLCRLARSRLSLDGP